MACTQSDSIGGITDLTPRRILKLTLQAAAPDRRRCLIGTFAFLVISQLRYLQWSMSTCASEMFHETASYRVGQKRKLLILSEYVNKTEKIGGT